MLVILFKPQSNESLQFIKWQYCINTIIVSAATTAGTGPVFNALSLMIWARMEGHYQRSLLTLQ